MWNVVLTWWTTRKVRLLSRNWTVPVKRRCTTLQPPVTVRSSGSSPPCLGVIWSPRIPTKGKSVYLAPGTTCIVFFGNGLFLETKPCTESVMMSFKTFSLLSFRGNTKNVCTEKVGFCIAWPFWYFVFKKLCWEAVIRGVVLFIGNEHTLEGRL